ncbi:hypothetical protein AB0I28_39190 [Phytomonospora sp. NPDC050363]|uniref:hypothetical protein n=1 Tax=Phytomonospora sp. NPDC050363 TaxID=3155642 RepID=UPI0033E6008F
MAEHQRNYPEPVNPSDAGSLWEPNTSSGRRSSDWAESPAPRHDPDSASTQAERWQLGGEAREPEPARHLPEPQVVDPELAALAGGDPREPRGPLPPAPPSIPEPRGPLPPTFDDAPRRGPAETPISGAPRPAPVGPPMPPPPPAMNRPPIDPPTQAYPAMPRGGERRTEPVNRRPDGAVEVFEGVYRKKRPAVVLLVVVVSALAMLPAAVVLLRSLFAGDGFSPSGVIAGVLMLAGIPLVGAGLAPLLGSGPRIGGREMSALMRPPYVYLVTGLLLLLAAGAAA